MILVRCDVSVFTTSGSLTGDWLPETECVPLSTLLSDGEDPTRVTELRLLGEHGALKTVISKQRGMRVCGVIVKLLLPVKVSLLLDAATFGIDRWHVLPSWESWLCSTRIDTDLWLMGGDRVSEGFVGLWRTIFGWACSLILASSRVSSSSARNRGLRMQTRSLMRTYIFGVWISNVCALGNRNYASGLVRWVLNRNLKQNWRRWSF